MRSRFLLPLAATITVVAVAGLAPTAHAQTFINFDDAAIGENIANRYAASGITFLVQDNLTGNPVSGPVFTTDAASISGPASLDGVDNPLFIELSNLYGTGATGFTIDLIPTSFFSPSTTIGFFNGAGTLVGSIALNGVTSTQTVSFNAAAFRRVALPGDAYFDNLRIVPAVSSPEPGSFALLATMALPLSGVVLRRRRRV